MQSGIENWNLGPCSSAFVVLVQKFHFKIASKKIGTHLPFQINLSGAADEIRDEINNQRWD